MGRKGLKGERLRSAGYPSAPGFVDSAFVTLCEVPPSTVETQVHASGGTAYGSMARLRGCVIS